QSLEFHVCHALGHRVVDRPEACVGRESFKSLTAVGDRLGIELLLVQIREIQRRIYIQLATVFPQDAIRFRDCSVRLDAIRDERKDLVGLPHLPPAARTATPLPSSQETSLGFTTLPGFVNCQMSFFGGSFFPVLGSIPRNCSL